MIHAVLSEFNVPNLGSPASFIADQWEAHSRVPAMDVVAKRRDFRKMGFACANVPSLRVRASRDHGLLNGSCLRFDILQVRAAAQQNICSKKQKENEVIMV